MPFRVYLPPFVYNTFVALAGLFTTTGLGWLVPARGPLNSFILLSEYYIIFKTFNNGSLGSGIDEERSEMR
jgi:hypothetical protein